MYSYQHRYHAGNFADLHKHIVLLAILKYLHSKPTSIGVLDAFAGEGFYDLALKEAQKNQEYLSGMGLISSKIAHPNSNRGNEQQLEQEELFADLLKITNFYSNLYNKNIYPGSPAIIASYLREQDSAVFVENHPHAYQELANNFKSDLNKNIKVFKRDAYDAVNALTPFKTKRGVVLLDPSYEVKSEYSAIAELINGVYYKTRNYIYIIWYPLLKNNHYSEDLFELFKKIPHDNIWCSSLTLVDDTKSMGMYGSGLIVINMPWNVDKKLDEHFNKLQSIKWESKFLM